MEKEIDSHLTEVVDKLQHVQVFSDLSGQRDALEKLARIMHKRAIAQGERIIEEGAPGDETFILLKGTVRVAKTTLQQEEYTVVILNDSMNAIIGELGLLDSDKRSASVLAETDCELLVINRKDFIEFGNQYPHLGLPITRQIAKTLSSRLRKSSQDLITLFSALVTEIGEGTL